MKSSFSLLNYPDGATPLDIDEAAGLIPHHISTQAQLNEWEENNIIKAERWAFSNKRSDILQLNFCTKLHKNMFDATWQWAGQFRRSNKNIGISWEHISVQLQLLFDDIKFQLAHNTYFLDELATRFHHRLVFIHPFANGNGRHARLMTDILLANKNTKKFTWGRTNLIINSIVRKNYIAALKAADKGNYGPLLNFVRT